MKKLIVLTLVLSLAAVSANAGVIASYDSGILAEAGAAGATDPTTQGWTKVAGGGQWNDAFDSGNGGWMIEDGTRTATTYYEQSLTVGNAAAMASGWTLTSTLSLLSDLTGQDGTFLEDWHQTNNNNNGHAFWIENADAGYFYYVRLVVDADDLYVVDGTNTYQITTDGSGYDIFRDYTIAYDGTDAVLSVDGAYYALASAGTGSTNRVIFGIPSSANYGSAIYNQVSIVPEPATMLLLGLGGLTVIRRKK